MLIRDRYDELLFRDSRRPLPGEDARADPARLQEVRAWGRELDRARTAREKTLAAPLGSAEGPEGWMLLKLPGGIPLGVPTSALAYSALVEHFAAVRYHGKPRPILDLAFPVHDLVLQIPEVRHTLFERRSKCFPGPTPEEVDLLLSLMIETGSRLAAEPYARPEPVQAEVVRDPISKIEFVAPTNTAGVLQALAAWDAATTDPWIRTQSAIDSDRVHLDILQHPGVTQLLQMASVLAARRLTKDECQALFCVLNEASLPDANYFDHQPGDLQPPPPGVVIH